MIQIELNKKTYQIPACWNELSQAQLLQVMETLFLSKYTADRCLLKLLKILCGMTYFEFFTTPVTSGKKRTGLVGKKVEVTGMDEFLYLTGFLTDDDGVLTKQLIPCYDTLWGPADECANLIMQEMVFTEQFFMQWDEDRENIECLDELCAILYRPLRQCKDGSLYDIAINPEGDWREPYNQNVCSHRAKNIICKWPMKVKLAIAHFYNGFRTELVNHNSEVFGGDGGESPKYGLISTIRRVAKEGALGNFQDVEQQYVSLVMIELNESIAEAKAQEKAQQQAMK
jgi:hypothetical protein